MALHFARPEYLLLLVLLPLAWLVARRLRTLGAGRKTTILALRTLILALLVLALAQLEWRSRAKDLTVYFLLDQSDSIPAELAERSTELVQEFMQRKTPGDEAGIIVFGREPSVETYASTTAEFDGKINSTVQGVRTDIQQAVSLALSAFPNDRLKRLVLFTDGNENSGSSLEVARLARNSNVALDLVPLRYDERQDVQIDKLIVPQQIAADTPFEIKAFLSSATNTSGRLRLYRDGELIVDQEVEVAAGRNPPLIIPQRLEEGGFHNYRATFEVPGDSRTQNNRAEAFTHVKDEPRVLYVEGDQTNRNYLTAALRAEKIQVDFASASEIPYSLSEIQSYDSIILSNVHASSMSRDQMKMFERAVHDLGVGLVMIGGEDSFGAGGYQDTPIEDALPVTMDVKQKKVLPNGALAIILHTAEIPQGNAWARDISIAALDVLSAQDYFGLIYYGPKPGQGFGGGAGSIVETWSWEPGMQQTGNKREMRSIIRGIQPMDMQVFDPTMEIAYQGLKDIKAQAKHIIIISDGDPAPPKQTLANAIRDEGITISTVAIAPHHGQTVETMERLAYWGGGEFYYPKSATELPRIFIKEASIVRRSLIYEERFDPVYDAPSEITAGFFDLPALEGYVVTSDKELATIALRSHKDDPLLAHWRYGLGKTVAFTSDAKNKWASDWVQWTGFSKYWSQLVRWSMRETSSSNFQVNTELRGGKGIVTLDAVDIDGDFRNFLEFNANVIGPDMEPQPLTVRQVAPGRYQGEFDADEVGTYMLSMRTGEDEQPELITSGVSLSYSPEYQAVRSNDEFIDRIAKESNGTVVGSGYNPFERNLPPTERPRPLWPWLLLAGLLLVPADVFVRRVYLDWGDVAAGIRKYAGSVFGIFRKGPDVEQRSESMGSLFAAKSRAKQTDEERQAAAAQQQDRSALRERLAQQAQEKQGEPSVFTEEGRGQAPARVQGKQTVSASDASEEKPSGGLAGLKKAKERARKKM
ncbi:MAG: glutamine amidotransferase [Sumerlaeia bacterium]